MKLILSQEIFKEYPIEFKEINPIDFTQTTDLSRNITTENQFKIDNNGEKIIIEPNKEGYINDEIQKKVELKKINTVVINAAVGQGKSYAILQTVNELFSTKNLNNYFVIVATPFTSLVKQYYDDIENLSYCKDNVYSYNSLQFDSSKEYLNKDIQVMTVNCLLQNPGEKSFVSSKTKRKYLTNLIQKCKSESKKVIFIFDEIHDSYHNFSQEYVFNLWKWKSVLHKNFVISATFNEASKVVIKYLAELTDNTIKIIESKRNRIPKKQSKLFLHFSPEHNFSPKTNEINSVITSLINRGKNLDILCYSKSLSKKIINKKSSTGKLLFETYGKVQNCTSQSNNKKPNHYDEEKCNIGTNFKTGVNIKKDNHAFVIIAPPLSSRNSFPNADGIFLGGINSVIQALARQRNPGEIHIILAPPNYFYYKSLDETSMNDTQKKYFKYAFDQIRPPIQKQFYSGSETNYRNINSQNELLTKFYYEDLHKSVKEEIKVLEKKDRANSPQLNYPDFETFKLKKGENYLASTFPIFGEDISSFITYNAITNQFINCELKAIYKRKNIYFYDGDFKEQISNHYKERISIYRQNILTTVCNFKMFYNELFKIFIEEFDSKYKFLEEDNTFEIKKLITSKKSSDFKLALLQFCVEEYYGKDFKYINGQNLNREDYIVNNIKKTESLDRLTLKSNEKKRQKLFKILGEFREFLITNILDYKKIKYLPIKPNSAFLKSKKNINNLNSLIHLLNYDDFFSDNIFIFKRNLLGNKPEAKKLNSLYTMLIDCFFEVNPKKKITINSKNRPEGNEILEIFPFPKFNQTIDTITDSSLNIDYINAVSEYNKGHKVDDIDHIINLLS